MSLYIGNLSARTRRDEIEHVFRRFGRCNVRLKDGYAFVVYDFPPNAEKALRALDGENIWGEPLNLTWSNKQPRQFQKYGRGARAYELHGRNSSSRKTRLNDWQDYRSGTKQPDSNNARFSSKEMLDQGRDFHQENMKNYDRDNCYDFSDELPTDGGSVVPKKLDSGRWGEQVDDLSNDNRDANGMMFDRYEPYQGYDEKDKEEAHWMANSDGVACQSPRENLRKEHDNDAILNRHNVTKSRQTCYGCGGTGHKMRNCPKLYSPQKKFTRINHRQDDEIKLRRRRGRLERFECETWGRLQSGRDAAMRYRNDSRASDSVEDQMLVKNGNSSVIKQTDKPQRKDNGEKKRNRMKNGSPKRYNAKKARSSLSGYPVSRSHSTSKSSKPVPSSVSCSRSWLVSSGADSLSSKSISSSKSRRPKSRSSSSPTTSLSLSVSLGSLPSTPRKAQLNQKGFLGKDAGTKLKGILDEQREVISSGADSLSSKSRSRGLVSRSRSSPTASHGHLSSPPDKAQMNHKGASGKVIGTKLKDMLDEQKELIEGDACFENAKVENNTVAVNGENAVAHFIMEEEMRENQHVQRNDDVPSRSSFVVTNPGSALPETGIPGAGSLSPEGLKESLEHQNSSALITGHMLKTLEQSDSELDTHASCSTSISMEELCMVLKHYGLELPKENERHLSMEAYFGSASLWPWQIIYYRRMKKGPISVQNYARRVGQNKNFGIVDKYIRSSSGWAEVDQSKMDFVG